MNTRRKVYLGQLAKYFISKGGTMTEAEYKAANDTPIRFFFVKRYFGKYARMLLMLEKNFPEVFEVIKPEVKPVVKPAVEPKAKPAVVVKPAAPVEKEVKDEDK